MRALLAITLFAAVVASACGGANTPPATLTFYTDRSGSSDVYVLDVNNSYSIVGAFNLMNVGVHAFADYDQAGLEMDCNGNLWAVNQSNKLAYKADSGETGACGWQAAWLSATPNTGTVAPGISTDIAVNVNATGMPVGTYEAYLRIVTNTPYGDLIVPVNLTIVDIFDFFFPLIFR